MNRLFYIYTGSVLAVCCWAVPADAITLDGMNIPSEGLTLRATQDSPTQFGDSTGTQSSTGGSELDQLFADVDNVNGVLNLGITGNLESNFNKLWIFFDAVSGGENVLLSDNMDGGFNEIQQMDGLTFPAGVTMDHALRLEIGGGFWAVRYANLITNTGGDIVTGGGPGDLPLADVAGAQGITFGWDNSNTLGVDGTTADNAATATTGVEFSIDLTDAFDGSQGDIKLVAFITSADGKAGSNQFLPGINSTSNPGDLSNFTISSVITVPGDPVGGRVLGDVDGDGDVDFTESLVGGDGVSDFDILRMNWMETNDSFGMTLLRSDGDLNENGTVGIEDFREWKDACTLISCTTAEGMAAAFASLGAGNVPEPTSAAMALLMGLGLAAGRWTRHRRTTSQTECDT
jgi:hypothetical protein